MSSRYVTSFNHCVSGMEYPLPDGFKEDSYGNDTCASAVNELLKVKLFVDHKNPDDREDPEKERFAVFSADEEGVTVHFLFESESYSEVCEFIGGLDHAV